MGDYFTNAEAVIERIAEIAETFSAQAGVGATETAGHLISYLADHSRDIEPLMRFGIFELPEDWMVRGRLTYMDRTGKVAHPETARHAQIIKRLANPQGS